MTVVTFGHYPEPVESDVDLCLTVRESTAMQSTVAAQNDYIALTSRAIESKAGCDTIVAIEASRYCYSDDANGPFQDRVLV